MTVSFLDVLPESVNLKIISACFFALSLYSLFSSAEAQQKLSLSNDAWPPYIVKGEQRGTAESLVCQALERSGWQCEVTVNDWDKVLDEARAGTIDGIVAAWRDTDRESYLLFSEPYLSNRIVPVTNNRHPLIIGSADDLAGLRVALVKGYAYGDEITSKLAGADVIEAKTIADVLRGLAKGDADVALVDELAAMETLKQAGMEDLDIGDTVLAFRDLHFAVSRQNPQAQQIIDEFQQSYELMLADGTVNEILGLDWLATDLGQTGDLSVVMRPGIGLDDLSNPTGMNDVYVLQNSEYRRMKQGELDTSQVKFNIDGTSYDSLQAAMDSVFGKDAVCKHKNFTSTFDCTDIFKQR